MKSRPSESSELYPSSLAASAPDAAFSAFFTSFSAFFNCTYLLNYETYSMRFFLREFWDLSSSEKLWLLFSMLDLSPASICSYLVCWDCTIERLFLIELCWDFRSSCTNCKICFSQCCLCSATESSDREVSSILALSEWVRSSSDFNWQTNPYI